MSLNIALKHTCFFIQGFAVALGVCELIQDGPAVSLGSGFLGLADACSIPGLGVARMSVGFLGVDQLGCKLESLDLMAVRK